MVYNMENEVKIVVKWSGKEYEICNLSESDSVGTLKSAIHKETGVRPERQKLLNLKLKGRLIYVVCLCFRLSAM
jgi:ubiquitin-like domain-containing CTD phosphatase 1